MTIFQAILLGIVQGLTEFLPVSSSGHLVLAPYFFGWEIPAEQAFVFDVLVQLGTLTAVIWYFWEDLWRIARAVVVALARRQPLADPHARLGWLLVASALPAGFGGLLLRQAVEAAFDSVAATAFFLLVTGGLLALAERLGKRRRSFETITWVDAVVMGCFQLLAVFPGVSRSGSTMAGGMIRDLERTAAARFSFLMSVPIMLAAGLLSAADLWAMPGGVAFLPEVIGGFVTSAIVGYLSIRWLLGYLARRPLLVFIVYVVVVGGTTLVSLAV